MSFYYKTVVFIDWLIHCYIYITQRDGSYKNELDKHNTSASARSHKENMGYIMGKKWATRQNTTNSQKEGNHTRILNLFPSQNDTTD
jgi:hypothetical protein